MDIRNAKNAIGIKATISGLFFALVYVGLEFSQSVPERISIFGEVNTITIWHFPLIWLLAGILFYCVFYAVGTIWAGNVKERAITFGFSVVVAVLLALFW